MKLSKSAVITPILALAIILILAAITTSGCQGGGTTPRDDYRKGTGSVDITFMPNAPPKEMGESQSYIVALKLKNVGAYDVKNGMYSIITDNTILDLGEKGQFSSSFSLRGRSDNYPDGEELVKTIPLKTKALPVESQKIETDISVTACMPYQTIHNLDLCMDADPWNLRSKTEKKPCQTKDITAGPSGGPVYIEKVEVRPEYDDTAPMLVTPKYTFIIRKPKDGLVTSRSGTRSNEAEKLCTGQNSAAAQSVELTAVLSQSQTLTCNRDSFTFNRDGIARVTCEGSQMDLSETGTYTTVLTVTLDYGYVKTQSAKVSIIR